MTYRKYLRLVIVVPCLLLSACAQMVFMEQDRLAMGGDFSTVSRQLAAQSNAPSQENTSDLVAACLAHAKLKSYDKLSACIAQMDANLTRGSRIIVHQSRFSWSYPENIATLPAQLSAEMHLDFGEYDQAVKRLTQAYQELPTLEWTAKDRTNAWPRRTKIRILGLLALAYALQGERSQALSTLEALESIEATTSEFWLTPGGISTIIAKEKRFLIARAYMSLGEYQKIIERSDESWDALGPLFEAVLGYSIFAAVDLPKKFMKSKALLETGKIAAAKHEFDALLNRPETKSNGEIYWSILLDRARIAQIEGQISQATDFLKQAVAIIENQRATIHTEASKIGFVGDKQSVYGKLVALLIEQGLVEEAFDFAERSKSRSLVDLLSTRKDFASRNQDPAEIRRVLESLSKLEREAHSLDAGREPSRSRGDATIVRQRISTMLPELASLVSVSSTPLLDLGKFIAPDETLLEYYYQGDQMFAFIVSSSGLHAIPLTLTGLIEEVQALRTAIALPESNDWQKVSQALYQRLWAPLAHLVSTTHVTVVPHGILHYLPFAALQRPSDQTFVLDQVSLRLLPSASVLPLLAPHQHAHKTDILAIGNPDLGDSRLDLVYAEEEARAITQGHADAQLLLRKDASETNFRKAGNYFSYIHFASHGKFNADTPLDSGLYLSKDEVNDGLLTVGELYSLSLNADLITLSACETGLGRVANGDDVVGLARGFLYAGSRSVVSSLWSIDDEATGTLMKVFYGNLDQRRKDDALRQAQLAVRQVFSHPYYWAAFQLTGRGD